MKSTKDLVSTALVIAALFTVPSASIYTVAQTQKVPTEKELVTLLKTAQQPAEHLQIAAYYRQEAARLRQSAKEHSKLAVIYGQSHPFTAMESKQQALASGASHCKKLADLAEKQASEADALAALHEGMAKSAEQKP